MRSLRRPNYDGILPAVAGVGKLLAKHLGPDWHELADQLSMWYKKMPLFLSDVSDSVYQHVTSTSAIMWHSLMDRDNHMLRHHIHPMWVDGSSCKRIHCSTVLRRFIAQVQLTSRVILASSSAYMKVCHEM